MTAESPPGVGLREIEEAYRRRYRAFARLAVAVVGDREQAHDAVQETFARAVRGRFDLRDEAHLDAWLARTLVNHCLDLRRREARARAHAPAPVHTNGAPAVDRELRAAVAALPERQRLVLFLRHYADLDYDAIAAALEISRGTVAATLHAAHERLRRTTKEGVR